MCVCLLLELWIPKVEEVFLKAFCNHHFANLKDTWVPPAWPIGQEHIQASTQCEMDQMVLMMLAPASIFLDLGMGRP